MFSLICDAPLYKLIGIDLENHSPEDNWMDIIPEHEKNVLESVTTCW